MPGQPRPEDFGLEVMEEEGAEPNPADFGLEVVEEGATTPRKEKVFDKQHPALKDIDRLVAENLTANRPELKAGYLQKQGFETDERNGDVVIRKPGEQDWYKVKPRTGWLEGLGKLVKLGMATSPVGPGYPFAKQWLQEGAGELLDLQGEGAKLGAAGLGAMAGGTAGLVAGPAGSAALGTAGAFAGGAAAQEGLLQLGHRAFGVPEPQNRTQVVSEEGANAALNTAFGEAGGTAARGVAKAWPTVLEKTGRAMEKPLLWKRAYEQRRYENVRDATGEAAEEAQAEAANKVLKDQRTAAKTTRADTLKAEREAKQKQREQEQAAMKARSTAETAVKAEATFEAGDFGKEAARIQKEINQHKQTIKGRWRDLRDEIEANKAAGNALDADEVASMKMELKSELREDEEAIEALQGEISKLREKAREVQSRSRLYSKTVADRNAEEAAAKAGGMKAPPSPSTPTAEAKPSTQLPSKEDVEKLIQNTANRLAEARRAVSARNAEARRYAADLMRNSKANRWKDKELADEWADEEWSNATEDSIRMWGEAVNDEIKWLEELGLPKVEARGVVEKAKARAEEILPPKPETPPGMKPESERAPRPVTAEFRMNPRAGRTNYVHFAGESLAQSGAFAGRELERAAARMKGPAPKKTPESVAKDFENYRFSDSVAKERFESPLLKKQPEAMVQLKAMREKYGPDWMKILLGESMAGREKRRRRVRG